MKSPVSRESSFSRLDKVRRHYGSRLARLFTCRDRLNVGMAWGAAALVVITLSTAGLARFPGEDRTDLAILPEEQRAPIKPSRLAHGENRGNTDIVIPQTAPHEPVPQTQAAIPDSTPEKQPGGGDRIDGSRNAAVVEAATPARASEKISIAATPEVEPPPIQAVTPPVQVSETTQDGSEINGLDAGQNNVAATSRVLPDFEAMDAPAAGDGAEQMVTAENHPVTPPVSREDKIAALLAKGQQSLREFRLLTPASDSANHYFREVLALDPGNTEARQGFNKIAERYVILARRAYWRDERKLAKVYISRGLQVQPGYRDLLALQDSMDNPPVTARETIAKVSPDVEPPRQQTGFFSNLKSLFTWKQDHPAEVVERSIISVNP